MQLFLIRHAQSLNNALPESQRVEDPPITDIGHEQARRLAEVLPALELTHLITSPFRRTLETTEHLRKAVGLSPDVRTELHELGGCMRGPSVAEMVGAPGMSRAEIEAEFAGYQISDEIDGDGWWGGKPFEQYEAARLRAKNLYERTLRDFADSDARVAYVMHADFKRIFLEQFYPVPEGAWNTSLTQLTITPQEVRVDDYNNIAHLSEELITA
jgi:2,3-bisphosphoglycerate-dependent phosphoglycerate mutase